MASSASGLVLITGVSGFVGNHVLNEFLQKSYRVRIAVRSRASGEKVVAAHTGFSSALELAIIPDITAPGAYDEAVKDVDGVVHMASPFTTNVTSNELDLLVPAIRGTTRILESVVACGSKVERVVLTSSFAAVNDFFKGLNPGYSYTEADWNPITYAQAKESDVLAYAGSKKLAEQAAWRFMDENKPAFTLSTICPPMIYGPPFPGSSNLKHLGTSAQDIYVLMNGSLKEVPSTPMPAWADVRDVASAHLKAFESGQSGRFLISSGRWSKQEVCDFLRESYPQLKERVPVGTPGDQGPACYSIDAGRAHRILGLQVRDFKVTFGGMAAAFLEMEGEAGV